MPDVRIGCSGFNYSHWRGTFYPHKLAQKKWLQHYCQFFSTVELNVTFYRIPTQSTFDRWYGETPTDFIFSLKGSRYITHVKRLLAPADSLELFFNGALRLKKKLNIVLWQLPPTFQINTERLVHFLKLLRRYPVRNALEFRHESWITADVFDICAEYGAGVCIADWPIFQQDLPITSDFMYIRKHGKSGRADTCYSKTDLQKEALRIKGYLKKGRDVFLYFNNDAQGYAPRNAQELMNILKPR